MLKVKMLAFGARRMRRGADANVYLISHLETGQRGTSELSN